MVIFVSAAALILLGAVLNTLSLKYKKISFYQINSFYREARVILDEARMNTDIINAVFLHAHNSGQDIYANTFLKSTVLEESPEFKELSAIKKWRNRPIDTWYRNLLGRVEMETFVPLEVDDVAGDLQALYVLYKVKSALVFKVYDKTKNSFFYVSFISKKSVKEIRFSRDFAILLIAVQRLTELCREYHDARIIK